MLSINNRQSYILIKNIKTYKFERPTAKKFIENRDDYTTRILMYVKYKINARKTKN